jgi:hypothetical protein
MNSTPQGQNFRPRRNNNNYKKSSGGGSGRQDFRRGSNFNSNTSSSNSHHARHPDLDIVIDSRAAQRASTMRDKYQSMARDAQTGGDRVYAEYCLQHTEHYNRILNAYNESRPQPVRQQNDTNENGDNQQNTDSNETPQAAQVTVIIPPTAEDEQPYQEAASN